MALRNLIPRTLLSRTAVRPASTTAEVRNEFVTRIVFLIMTVKFCLTHTRTSQRWGRDSCWDLRNDNLSYFEYPIMIIKCFIVHNA